MLKKKTLPALRWLARLPQHDGLPVERDALAALRGAGLTC